MNPQLNSFLLILFTNGKSINETYFINFAKCQFRLTHVLSTVKWCELLMIYNMI